MYVHVDPNSRLGRFILILGIPLFGAIVWFEILWLTRTYQSTAWPIAAGTIIESRVDRHVDVHGMPHSVPRIRYRYAVKGRQFESDSIVCSMTCGVVTWGYADRKVRAWPKGKGVNVRYDPDDPSVACLEPGSFGWEDIFFLILPAAGVFYGLEVLRSSFRRLANGRLKPSAAAD